MKKGNYHKITQHNKYLINSAIPVGRQAQPSHKDAGNNTRQNVEIWIKLLVLEMEDESRNLNQLIE